MADIATSSAAAMSTIDAGADHPEKDQKQTGRPTKPDEDAYKKNLQKAEKEHVAAQEKINALKAKIDLAQPQSRDSPSSKRRQELQSDLASIKQQQSSFKNSRGDVQGKLAALDAQLKSRMAEQKTKRAQVPWKNVAEIDAEIQRQEKVVESGRATILEEKKAVEEQSRLRKQRKAFAGFDEALKGIDNVKAQITELRKSLDNPEAKSLSTKYDAIDKELKIIRAEQDEAYKGLNALRDERSKAHAEQQEKWIAMRAIKDEYFKARRAYKEHEDKIYHERQARQKEERDAYNKEKRKKLASQKLEEASEPAYMDEILTAEGLIRYFDPSAPEAAKTLRGPSGFAAEPMRSVDTNSEIKGMKVSKKEDREEDYFIGTGGKKGKKGRKGGSGSKVESPTPGTPIEGKFHLSIGIIEELAKVGIEPPMAQSAVPSVVEKLKAKREHWKQNQDTKTKENIAKAQKEIDRLEEEAKNEQQQQQQQPTTTTNRRTHDSSKNPVEKIQAVNGTSADAGAELSQEKDAAADASEDLKKASLEEKEEE